MKKAFLYIGFAGLGLLMGATASVAQAVKGQAGDKNVKPGGQSVTTSSGMKTTADTKQTQVSQAERGGNVSATKAEAARQPQSTSTATQEQKKPAQTQPVGEKNTDKAAPTTGKAR